VNPDDSTSLPLLDIAILTKLGAKPEAGHGIWRVYAGNFLAEVPLILKDLRIALTSGDVRGGVDSLVGLRMAGQLMGALRLASLTLNLEAELRRAAAGPNTAGALPGLAALHLQGIVYCAQKTILELRAALG
jgi:hypothetical protein